MELLTEVKSLISSYSYDAAMNLLETFLKEKSATTTETIPENKYQEIKEAYDLLLYVIEQKNDDDLKNKISISKIKFLSRSSKVEDIAENIQDIESYLKISNRQYCYLLNILWQAYLKIGELEKATIIASRYLDELLKFKHFKIYERSYKEITSAGIKCEYKYGPALLTGIRLESYLEKCLEIKAKKTHKDLINLLYELTLFFDDNRILIEISDIAVQKQNKNLLLVIEKFVRLKKINNQRIEANISRFGNFPDQSMGKSAGDFDFADDLFAKGKAIENKKTEVDKNKIEKFTNTEKYLYFDLSAIKTEKDLLNLVDNEENFLELASFMIEMGLNRKAVGVLEKYLIQDLDRAKIRDLYHLYITALLACGEDGLAKKTFNDFCLNSSLSKQEKNGLQVLFKSMDTSNQ